MAGTPRDEQPRTRTLRSPWAWALALAVVAVAVWGTIQLLGSGDVAEGRGEDGLEPVAPSDVAPGAVPEDAAEEAAPDDAPPGADRPVVGAGVQPALEEYRARCSDPHLEANGGAAIDELAATCVRVLSGALASVIGRDTVADLPLRELLAEQRAAARRIEELRPGSRVTGELVRAVFTSAASVMEHVARTRATATAGQRARTAEARVAAERVDAGVPLRDQWPAARSFFREAGEAIEALDR